MEFRIAGSAFTRFKKLLSVDKEDISQVYIYAFLNGLVNLSLPLGIQAIVNLIQGGEISTAWIVLVSFVMAGVAFTGILQLMQLRIVENIAQKIFSRASFEFAYRIPRIKYSALRDYYGPDLANRFFDTMTIQKGLPKILIDFSLAIFQVIAGLILLSLYHSFFIIFSVLLVIVVFIIIAITGPKGLKTSLNESSQKYKIAFWLEEIARSKLSFKLASGSKLNLNKVNDNVEKYLDSRESHFKVLITQSAYFIAFKVLVAAGLLVIGSILVFNEQMNIGQFVAAEIIIILIIASIEKLIQTLDSIYDVLTALEKIGYVFDKPMDKTDGLTFRNDLEAFQVEVDNLSFRYENAVRNTLSNLTFKIPEKSSVVITGPSGSGKSTLLKIISGILDPSSGLVKYNGLPIGSLDMDNVMKDIGFCISHGEIFHGTILENISLQRERATADNIKMAIEVTGLDEYVSKMPLGLKTIVDPEGKKVPRNIQNRILLARAIVTKPILLILEDPLDHVSSEEKQKIISRLTEKDKPWSIIVSSVDTTWESFIKDKIMIENGELVYSTLKDDSNA